MSSAADIEHPPRVTSASRRRVPPAAAMRLHDPRARLRGMGVFRVARARTPLANLLGRCLRLPAHALAVHTELLVDGTADGARWARRFGDRWLITTQRFGASGELVERFGAIELTFRLLGYGDWLVFHQVCAAIHVGPFRLRLPTWAAPHVAGRVRCSPQLDRLEARVRLRAPLFGELVRYGARWMSSWRHEDESRALVSRGPRGDRRVRHSVLPTSTARAFQPAGRR